MAAAGARPLFVRVWRNAGRGIWLREADAPVGLQVCPGHYKS